MSLVGGPLPTMVEVALEYHSLHYDDDEEMLE